MVNQSRQTSSAAYNTTAAQERRQHEETGLSMCLNVLLFCAQQDSLANHYHNVARAFRSVLQRASGGSMMMGLPSEVGGGTASGFTNQDAHELMPGLKADFSMPGVTSTEHGDSLFDIGTGFSDAARKPSDVSLSHSIDSPNTNISTGCATDITSTTDMTSVAPSGPPTGQPLSSGLSMECFNKPGDLSGAGEDPGLPPQVHDSFFPSIEGTDEFSGVLADLQEGWAEGMGNMGGDMDMDMEKEMGEWLGGGGFG